MDISERINQYINKTDTSIAYQKKAKNIAERYIKTLKRAPTQAELDAEMKKGEGVSLTAGEYGSPILAEIYRYTHKKPVDKKIKKLHLDYSKILSDTDKYGGKGLQELKDTTDPNTGKVKKAHQPMHTQDGYARHPLWEIAGEIIGGAAGIGLGEVLGGPVGAAVGALAGEHLGEGLSEYIRSKIKKEYSSICKSMFGTEDNLTQEQKSLALQKAMDNIEIDSIIMKALPEEESEEQWYDEKGNASSSGAYDAGGHVNWERLANKTPDQDDTRHGMRDKLIPAGGVKRIPVDEKGLKKQDGKPVPFAPLSKLNEDEYRNVTSSLKTEHLGDFIREYGRQHGTPTKVKKEKEIGNNIEKQTKSKDRLAQITGYKDTADARKHAREMTYPRPRSAEEFAYIKRWNTDHPNDQVAEYEPIMKKYDNEIFEFAANKESKPKFYSIARKEKPVHIWNDDYSSASCGHRVGQHTEIAPRTGGGFNRVTCKHCIRREKENIETNPARYLKKSDNPSIKGVAWDALTPIQQAQLKYTRPDLFIKKQYIVNRIDNFIKQREMWREIRE